jgi:hypothetical protein
MRTAEAYLAATRREVPALVARDHYAATFAHLQSGLSSFGAAPEFFVTFSPERTCETVRIKGRTVVIYDQYLGQTFNQLNRLHANSTNPFEAVVYSCKVAGEFAEIDGQIGLAGALSTAYALHRHRASTHRSDVDVARRMRVGATQEAYVMAHEAFHSILEQQPQWLVEMVSDARGDFLNNYYLPMLVELGKTDAESLNQQGDVYLDQIRRFAEDDALVEECICDTLAISLFVVGAQDLEESRSAIYFALRHLRLLAIIRQAVRAVRSSQADDDFWINPYLVRMQFLKWTLEKIPNLSKVWNDDEAQGRFTAEQQRYDEYVERPILNTLPAIIDQLSSHEIDGKRLIDGFDADFLSFLWEDRSQMAEAMKKLGESFFVKPWDQITNDNYPKLWEELKKAIGPLAPDAPTPQSRRPKRSTGGS